MRQAKRKKDQNHSLANFLTHRVQEGLFILVSAGALYLFLAMLTYNGSDPGWSRTAEGADVANIGGYAGALFADVVLYLCGYVAYLFPIMIIYGAWAFIQQRDKDKAPEEIPYYLLIVRCCGALFVLLAACGLCSLHLKTTANLLPFSAGGVLGNVVGFGMVRAFNAIGASLILLSLFLTGVTLFTGLSWLKVADKAGELVLAIIRMNLWSDIWERFKSKEPENEFITGHTKTKVEPRITPKVTERPVYEKPKINIPKPIEISARAENDRQATLFQAPMDGTLPPLTLLDLPDQNKNKGYSQQELENMSREVELRLRDFGVVVHVTGVLPGPVVTRFELELAAGTKVSKISSLAKDLARSLSTISVRIVEVIPGKSVIGIELPNQHREVVRLREILSSQQYENARSPLTMALGKDIAGHPVIVDLAKMPHLLVAGTTGSGKSVGLNAMLLSLLYKSTPSELRIIMIDPKMLELSIYDGIPHLLTPVVTDMKDASIALRWCVMEMERRYRLMASLGVRNIAGYNTKVKEAIKKGAPLLDPLWQAEMGSEPAELETLPYIVVLADEFADMMVVVGKKVEELITRIAQKARAAGIHLILATQRPSVDVITGLIKANIPTRIAFQVSSKIDSRTILDQSGADQLLGNGDMLYLAPGTGVPVRVHGAYVADEEVHRVVSDIKQRGVVEYLDDVLAGDGESDIDIPGLESGSGDGEQDSYYDEAVRIVTETQRVSISSIQRRLKIGYNRAARIVESMEAAGVVSAMSNNGSRDVLAPPPPPRD